MQKDTNQSTYTVVYPKKAVETAALNLEDTYRGICELLSDHDLEPIKIILPDGREIKWHPQIFHHCFDNGHCSEEWLINTLEIKEKEVSHV